MGKAPVQWSHRFSFLPVSSEAASVHHGEKQRGEAWDRHTYLASRNCAERRQLHRSLKAAWLLELDTFFYNVTHSDGVAEAGREAKRLLQEEATCTEPNWIHSFCSTTFDHILKIQMKHLRFPILPCLFWESGRLSFLHMVHSDNGSLSGFYFFFLRKTVGSVLYNQEAGWLA